MVSDVRVGTAEAAQGGRPTLKTIAYMTGLGVTTVSRALTGSGPVSPENRGRVLAAAKKLNYHPNTVAEFQYELGPWKEICIAPANMYNGEFRNAGDLKV